MTLGMTRHLISSRLLLLLFAAALLSSCSLGQRTGSRKTASGRTTFREASSPNEKKFEVGLWVQAEGSNRTLDSLQKIDALVLKARSSGITDIYAQVYRSGRSWYPTTLADDTPARRAGRDPLAYLLQIASGEGTNKKPIRVHAWINAFSLARNRKAPILAELGDDAVLKDQFGRSLLEYPEDGRPPWAKGFALGTPSIFLDPANIGVRRRFVDIAAELLERYPMLAGIHLDFIRYPYALPISPGSRFSPRLDFGYGEQSVARFQAETGRKAPAEKAIVSSPDYQAWDDWRRRQVTETVRQVHGAVKAFRPQAVLSAAVLPWTERAYLTSFQDWRGWLQEGILDKAVVMNYTRDLTLSSRISRSVSATRAFFPGGKKGRKKLIIIGLGAWLFTSNTQGLWEEWHEAQRAGADGIAFFSYDQMLDHGDMWAFPPIKTP